MLLTNGRRALARAAGKVGTNSRPSVQRRIVRAQTPDPAGQGDLAMPDPSRVEAVGQSLSESHPFAREILSCLRDKPRPRHRNHKPPPAWLLPAPAAAR